MIKPEFVFIRLEKWTIYGKALDILERSYFRDYKV